MLVGLLLYAVFRNKVVAYSFVIGQWAHAFTDTGDTVGTMLFFPFTDHLFAVGAWAYAGQTGRYVDAGAYFSGLGFVWDGVFVVWALLSWRVITRAYFRETIVVADPFWSWAGRYVSENVLIVALPCVVLLRDRPLDGVADLGARRAVVRVRPPLGRAALGAARVRGGSQCHASCPAVPRIYCSRRRHRLGEAGCTGASRVQETSKPVREVGTMPFYVRLGDVPRKRHIVFRDNGRLLTEEVMGLEGFTGNESILYHLQSPCRVKELGEFEPIEHEEWVPEAHAHRHLTTYGTEPSGDEITGRRVLMWNDDVEISLCRPASTMDYFFRNGEHDECVFVHEGSGTLETTFGNLSYRDGDYVMIPRGTTYRFVPEGEQRHLVFESPGLITIPRRYRNEYGQLLEGAPYSNRDIHPPTELQTIREQGEFVVKVRVRGGYQTYILDYHPFDVVGWDGYLFPWTFSVHDFEPITGRIHQPPPAHQTFQGQNFVICSFCPRKLDFDPEAVPIPYHHSNLQSEEMIYYVSGNFGVAQGRSRSGRSRSTRRACRTGRTRPRREVARCGGDDRAGGDVRHVPAAAPLGVRGRARRRALRLLVVRAGRGRSGLAGVTSHL